MRRPAHDGQNPRPPSSGVCPARVPPCAAGLQAALAGAARRVTRPRPGGGRRGEAKRPFEFPSRPQAKVVVVSDDDNLLLRAAARAAGAVGYVLKENLLEVRGLLQSAAAKESNNQLSMNEE